MPAMIPPGRDACNRVGLPYTAFDGPIPQNANDSAKEKLKLPGNGNHLRKPG
jgi:hypothetical protein